MLLDADTAAVLGAATGLACAFINYGIMKATVSDLQERQKQTDKEIAALGTNFVPYREFQTTSKHLEESLKRIDVSITRLTELILERANNRATRSDSSL